MSRKPLYETLDSTERVNAITATCIQQQATFLGAELNSLGIFAQQYG